MALHHLHGHIVDEAPERDVVVRLERVVDLIDGLDLVAGAGSRQVFAPRLRGIRMLSRRPMIAVWSESAVCVGGEDGGVPIRSIFPTFQSHSSVGAGEIKRIQREKVTFLVLLDELVKLPSSFGNPVGHSIVEEPTDSGYELCIRAYFEEKYICAQPDHLSDVFEQLKGHISPVSGLPPEQVPLHTTVDISW